MFFSSVLTKYLGMFRTRKKKLQGLIESSFWAAEGADSILRENE